MIENCLVTIRRIPSSRITSSAELFLYAKPWQGQEVLRCGASHLDVRFCNDRYLEGWASRERYTTSPEFKWGGVPQNHSPKSPKSTNIDLEVLRKLPLRTMPRRIFESSSSTILGTRMNTCRVSPASSFNHELTQLWTE